MRNTVQVLMVLSLAIVLSFSCNLVMPDRVQIIGSPTVDVSVGAVSVDITKYLDLEQMLTDSLSGAFSDSGDSFDNETIGDVFVIKARKQLFTQPLGDIFDMDTGLGGLTQTIEPMSFEVPSFTNEGAYSQILEGDSLGTLSIPGLPPIELVEATVSSQIITVPPDGLDITDFDSLTLAEGFLVVDLSTTDASIGLVLEVSGARLLGGDDTELAVASIGTPVNVNPSGSISFDLTGVTLPNQIKFELVISMANPDSFNPYTLNLAASLEGLNILDASGVSFSDTVTGTESVTLEKPADLVSATIGTGELVITLEPPAGFTGVTTDFSATLTFEGSQARPAVLDTGSTYKISLDGITLSTFDPASLVYDLEVTGSDATVAFPADFGITTSLAITNFSEVILTAADLDFSYSEPFIISQDILDAVQSATFSDAQLVFNLTNGLPSDLVINFNSQVLTGNTPEALTFPGNSSVLDTQSISLANSIDFTTDLVTVGSDQVIDINLDLSLAGYSGGQLTLTNVTPGLTYPFSGNFELVLELDTVTLANVNQTGTFPEGEGDPLDFSMLDDIFPAGVLLEGVTTLLELQNPLGGSLELVLLGRYSESGMEPFTYVDLLDDPSDTSPIVGVGDFLSPADYANFVDLNDGDSIPIYLADLVNARTANLELAYSVTFSTATLDLTVADAGSIDVFLDIGLPLQLNVTTEGGVYWMPEEGDPSQPVLNITEDLLGRTIPGDSEELEQVFDFLTKASLRYNLENSVISGESGYPEIVISQVGLNDALFEKRIPLGGSSSVELDWQDIEFIRNNLFIPTVELFLPQGLININPSGELILGLSLRLETDIVHEFAFGKDDSNDQ